MTTTALQAGAQAEKNFGKRADEATSLAAQFDGLAELSNECL
jgi:hypothetical protein